MLSPWAPPQAKDRPRRAQYGISSTAFVPGVTQNSYVTLDFTAHGTRGDRVVSRQGVMYIFLTDSGKSAEGRVPWRGVHHVHIPCVLLHGDGQHTGVALPGGVKGGNITVQVEELVTAGAVVTTLDADLRLGDGDGWSAEISPAYCCTVMVSTPA